MTRTQLADAFSRALRPNGRCRHVRMRKRSQVCAPHSAPEPLGGHRQRAESTPHRGPHGHSEERMKALLVDDHILFREGLALLMSNAFPDLDCQQAGSIAQALQVLGGDAEIRLVLLDLGLPDSAGVTSLRRLREG